MKKQIQLFLAPEDEGHLSRELRQVRAQITFVDDNVWPGAQPVTRDSIDACESGLVYLWDRAMVASLPSFKRKDGRTEGPTSGVVVQLVRSRLKDNILLSGRMAAGTGLSDERLEAVVRDFIADVWRVLSKSTAATLAAIEPATGDVIRAKVLEYRAGAAALAWALQSASRYFKDRSTENYFRPRTM